MAKTKAKREEQTYRYCVTLNFRGPHGSWSESYASNSEEACRYMVIFVMRNQYVQDLLQLEDSYALDFKKGKRYPFKDWLPLVDPDKLG